MSDLEDLQPELDKTEALKLLPWRRCTKPEAKPYWLKTVVATYTMMGTTKTSFYEQCMFNPNFPRWLVDGQFYFDPFEVGLWCASNTGALQEQQYSKRFVDSKYNTLKSRAGKKIEQAELKAADEFDKEWDLQDSSTSKHPEIIRQKIRSMTIAGDIAQIQLDKASEVLVNRKKFEEDEAARVTMLKNRLLAMPAEVSVRLENKNSSEIQDELDTHVRNIWEQITTEVIETPVEEKDNAKKDSVSE